MFGSWKGLFSGLSSPSEVLIQEINVSTALGKEMHSKDYFQTNISHQERLFKES